MLMPLQAGSRNPFLMEKLNSSGFGSLTRGYFGFADNMLSGKLPSFLSRNQVSNIIKSLINLQV